jgi:membrane protein
MKALMRRHPGVVLASRAPDRLAHQLSRVATCAIRNYIVHQSANQAASVAFSFLIAMFPLLILLASAAGFIGRPGDAATLADDLLSYAPAIARDALGPAVGQVLRQRSQALVTLGLIATLWSASSGIQSSRTALNRAYGVKRGLPFWKARIKVIVFTIVAGAGTMAAFGSVIVMPYVWQLLHRGLGMDPGAEWVHDGVRYGVAFVVLCVVNALLYGWPDVSQSLRSVVPGAVCGALLWIAAAAILSVTLRNASRLILIYGGFAGAVATLIFLYLSASTLILGAEINAAIARRRVDP